VISLFSSLIPLSRRVPHDCGTKATNLSRLVRLGYSVPAGIVVPNGEYQEHLRRAQADGLSNELLSVLPGLSSIELYRAASEIRNRITTTPLAPRLRVALQKKLKKSTLRWPVAVRSSATAEDSDRASFAGQLDSVLGVDSLEKLEDAVRFVWASLWSDRCLCYVQQNGIPPGRIGVIIQEQVDARCSGVLFTRNPLDDAPEADAVIEYVAGLGDQLVSGGITPGRLRVRYADMNLMDDESALGPVRTQLPVASVAELVRIGLVLERKFGGPQDIEWSIDHGGQLYLLQTRPITATGKIVNTVWSNANIAENFPDPVTPFLFSIVSRGYTAYFRNLGLGFGISRRRIDAMSASLDSIVGLHAGRLYYNLSSIHSALRLAPRGEHLADWFNQFTGASEFPATRSIKSGIFQRSVEFLRIVAMTTWKYLWIGRRVAAFEATVDRYAEFTHPQKLTTYRQEELSNALSSFLDIRLNRWNDAALADAAAMVCYGLLTRAFGQSLSGRKSILQQNDLLKGLPGLASAKPVIELWNLSRYIQADKELHQLFSENTAEEIAEYLRKPGLHDFQLRFEQYLDRWGFRYSRELMLTSPTPQENPLPMLRLLQCYLLDDGAGPEAISAGQARDRIVATQKMMSHLTPQAWIRLCPLSRAGRFHMLLHAAQSSIRLRERARMKQALLYTRLRHVMLSIGDVFVMRGFLKQREEVFFLAAEEVKTYLSDAADPALIPTLINSRRDEFYSFSTIQPPDSFLLPAGEKWHQSASTLGMEPYKKIGMLFGTSACGGSSVGPAVVVHDVAEIGAIRAGQILVTRQTDPGWAAVFFLVKGLVIERGGMLSHGAIIAREYGIPAVVGVNDATSRILNGEQIRVDGDKGVVELHHG
jgi:rifampicin phosphotransferase